VMSRPAPPKPWELRKSSSSTSSNAPLPGTYFRLLYSPTQLSGFQLVPVLLML
jgi:hypothetical protein